MAAVSSPKNDLLNGALHSARTAYEMPAPILDENQPHERNTSVTSNNVHQTVLANNWRSPPARKDSLTVPETRTSKRLNGHSLPDSDEDIPENMYRPDKDNPEGWIHRDKLAKIESEELQAAGINLANARTRSQSSKTRPESTGRDTESKREEKRQRLQSPPETEEELNHEYATWDFRLPDEIEADNSAMAAQMYANPVLRKSGSKIPVLTSSPLPIPAERYERDTPIARKRTASGTMSFEGDTLNIAKLRNTTANRSADDSDGTSSVVASSKPASPHKSRSKSATVTPTPGHKQTNSVNRKTSAPPRASPTPGQRPGTRSGEHDRPRTAINRPEGDPPWLATMYKPDPRLPPDQQLIPTLAKKQMQAQWAEEGAVPKVYDRDFTPIAIHNQEDLAPRESFRQRSRTPSPVKHHEDFPHQPEIQHSSDQSVNSFPLKPVNGMNSNHGRPGTSGSITGAYSTMPKVASPTIRENGYTSPKIGPTASPSVSDQHVTGGRPTNMPPPQRMQAQSLTEEDDGKIKKGCGCCIVM